MVAGNWMVFGVALAAWAVLFYGMDLYVMSAQGLPVGANLMPK